jgi:hypothetical protein
MFHFHGRINLLRFISPSPSLLTGVITMPEGPGYGTRAELLKAVPCLAELLPAVQLDAEATLDAARLHARSWLDTQILNACGSGSGVGMDTLWAGGRDWAIAALDDDLLDLTGPDGIRAKLACLYRAAWWILTTQVGASSRTAYQALAVELGREAQALASSGPVKLSGVWVHPGSLTVRRA